MIKNLGQKNLKGKKNEKKFGDKKNKKKWFEG